MKNNSPDDACGFVPVTGASRNSHPFSAAAAASSLTKATEIVLQSSNSFPGATPASAPSGRSQTPRDAASSATIAITTSARADASRGVSATRTPEAPYFSAFSRLRLYTVSGNPMDRRREAIPPPMIPKPSIATCGFDIISILTKSLRCVRPPTLPRAPYCEADGRIPQTKPGCCHHLPA